VVLNVENDLIVYSLDLKEINQITFNRIEFVLMTIAGRVRITDIAVHGCFIPGTV